MKYDILQPPPGLSNIVQHYWSLEGKILAGQKYIHRTLANSHPELIFHYGGTFRELITDKKTEKTFITGLHGQTDKIRRFTATETCGIFGVILQPYAIPLLFGMPSQETKNQLIEMSALMGQCGKELSEQMLSAENNKQRVRLITQFLIKRLTEFKRPDIVTATQTIYKLKGSADVNELAARSCLSLRQFERKFIEHIGFSPKTFARLVRFKSIIDSYKKENATLTEAAYDFGYYDQAHFIQEFKQFSGYNPGTYFSGGATDVFYAP